MKINQIQLPDTLDKLMHYLDELDKDDLYVVYFLSPGIAEKYKVTHPLKMREFDSIWNSAVERGSTESVACNLLYGRSALVRIE